MRRVAVTGLGAVTPLGRDVRTTWEGMVAGRSGVSQLATFDASTFPVRIAAQVQDFDVRRAIPRREDRRYLSRAAQFGLAAALEAIGAAGDAFVSTDPYDRGVSMGGTVGRPQLQELVDMSHLLASSQQASIPRQAPADVLTRDQNVGVAAIARAGDCRGPVVSVSTACAGAAHAIGEGMRRIQDGECTLVLAGGFDALTTWMDVLGFSLLGALTDGYNDDPGHASRPFAADRSGFVLGEGAVVAVLEDWDHAVARGGTILAELAGYGSSLNAYRITDSPPDGGGAIAAMRDALIDAALPAEAVDYVVAHGTGTPGNDISETAAVKAVFGAHAYDLVVSSPKSVTGHLTSAAAGINLVAAVGALREQVIPPTVNLDHPDPRLDLDYVPHVARRWTVRTVMANAFAFGGTNASLVLRAASNAEEAA